MSKGLPKGGLDFEDDEMGKNEDAQTQADFERFKDWLQSTYGESAAANRAKRASSASSLSESEAPAAPEEAVHPKEASAGDPKPVPTPTRSNSDGSGTTTVGPLGEKCQCGKENCN